MLLARSGGAALALVAALGPAGCVETPCGPRLSCEVPGVILIPDERPCVADPRAGLVDDGCGVFVSASLGDDAAAGTRGAPVKTIAEAVKRAADGPGRAYACAEVFEEAARVPAGVAIWGGLDCRAGWIYVGDQVRTVIAPGPDEVPLTFLPGEGVSLAADVEARAADAALPGGSSVAAIAQPGATVEILRAELAAGDGARGRDGAPGHPRNQPARAGLPGDSGGEACTLEVVHGGAQVQTACEGLVSIGGQGGQGTASAGGPGLSGELSPVPNPYGFGLGGWGASVARGCMNGSVGDNGEDGAHGAGARRGGRLTPAGYAGVDGADGGQGRPGQGGGGGGGSLAGLMFCGPGGKDGGAGGGSGGSGGCGGRGGRGGGHGGASIGLISVNAEVSVRASVITTGRGGDGGIGGFFQIGGAPGPAGIGGRGAGGSPFGCDGGTGGKGGNGGHGGGGLGGPSIGVAYLFGAPPKLEGVSYAVGAAGAGGQGANPDVLGSAGEDGEAGESLGFPP
ncbi:hypothetical protein AB3662_01310 [Sorangium cellulosum]|uniref:hypothetical protein n=1 Tax=Sorangium cellulosum TaxID=56 RepID=UPI003D9A22E5